MYFTFLLVRGNVCETPGERKMLDTGRTAAQDLLDFLGDSRFGCVLADPPWRFTNRSGKIAPENKLLPRYPTLSLDEICGLPVGNYLESRSHCYLWVPNALLPDGLAVLSAWGFTYKSNIVWHKVRKDGGSDGRGVGFYFRNVTEVLLFGTRGKSVRTLSAGRRQVNVIASRKREHSRKPDEQYDVIQSCSWGPYLELFGRGIRSGWTVWGNQADADYKPEWKTYAYNSAIDGGQCQTLPTLAQDCDLKTEAIVSV
jgi:N6-adenosine-specific RNA methylase IME4